MTWVGGSTPTPVGDGLARAAGLTPSHQRAILHCKCNALGAVMKTASIPSLRVEPELRKAAENVLREGESLSHFVEESIPAEIKLRRSQQVFIARGLASREDARSTGVYYSAKDVMDELDGLLSQAETDSTKS